MYFTITCKHHKKVTIQIYILPMLHVMSSCVRVSVYVSFINPTLKQNPCQLKRYSFLHKAIQLVT